MTRLAVKLVVFLLFGAMVNVGVAWGCAVWIGPPGSYVPPPLNMDARKRVGRSEGWSAYRYDSTGVMRIVAYWAYEEPGTIYAGSGFFDASPKPPAESLVPGWAAVIRPHGEYSLGRYRWVADARGWPMLSMWGGAKTRNIGWMSGGWVEREAHPIRAILIQPDDEDDAWMAERSKLIPLAPIFSGFAINTLLYGTVLWLLCVAPLAPFRVRRYLRRKRGHCIKCGYDLRHAAHEVCPECGAGTVSSA